MLKRTKTLLTIIATLSVAACTPDSGFFLNGEQNTFLQSVTQSDVKVDILWVVDNSGSMATSQSNVAANFQSFIDKFQSTNFDYQMAVTTTEAWRAPLVGDPDLARFKDGTDATSHTGVFVINKDTPDLEQTFITNIVQGITGSGDERGLQSMQEALSHPTNLAEPFPREGALLAVIVLTDEEDFSHNGSNNIQGIADPYNYAGLHEVQAYHDFLYNLTNSTESQNNFIFNTVAILDETCRNQLNTTFTGRRVGQRYIDLSDLSGGYKGSLCDDFSNVLGGITDAILEFSTRFPLNREPAVASIVVKVNGETVPQDVLNGWTYDAETVAIIFHGTAIPGQDALVSVTFDPAGLK